MVDRSDGRLCFATSVLQAIASVFGNVLNSTGTGQNPENCKEFGGKVLSFRLLCVDLPARSCDVVDASDGALTLKGLPDPPYVGAGQLKHYARLLASDVDGELTHVSCRNLMENRSNKRKVKEEVRSDEHLLPFTSRTRNLSFQFEGPTVSFAGVKDCAYKVRQFSYRRAGHVTLRNRRCSFSRSRLAFR